MINVCANHHGEVILLETFTEEEQAKEFMKYDYVLHYADEFENAEEDDIIHSYEMFIEDEIPFFEKVNNIDITPDELPF